MFRPAFILFIFLSMALASLGQYSDRPVFSTSLAGTEPFLYSVTSLTPDDRPWSFNYSGSYGDNVSGNFGYDGVNQQLAVKGYLGSRFTLYAFTAIGFPGENNVESAQQAEVIRNFIGGKKSNGIILGWSLGMRRDFSNDFSLLSRGTLSFTSINWKMNGNVLFEKTFASNRDAVDVITSLGVHYCFTPGFSGGVEAIGEDLEGFWDKEEAEGGAKILVGPSLNIEPKKTRFSFCVSGGPVFYATQNQQTNTEAIRELPSGSGLMIKARIIYSLSSGW
jgi:hypothetical protein